MPHLLLFLLLLLLRCGRSSACYVALSSLKQNVLLRYIRAEPSSQLKATLWWAEKLGLYVYTSRAPVSSMLRFWGW